jgi:hypothetical protein
MRRGWLIALTAFVLVLVPVGMLLPVLFPSASKVTSENAKRIKEGMTRAEVEEILGGPPGDYRNGPTRASRDRLVLPGPNPLDLIVWEVWWGDEAVIAIRFDAEESKVKERQSMSDQRVDGSFHELLSWRLFRWASRTFQPKQP